MICLYNYCLELISLWISEQIVLPPALINSVGIWSIPVDQSLFSFSIAILKSKALSSGTRGSAVCIFLGLTSLTRVHWTAKRNGSSTWPKYLVPRQSVTKSPFSSFTTLVLGRKPFLTFILLMWRIWWALNNASKWQMGFNSAFKGLTL